MQRIFVTGANRGLGLEFTRQFAARGDLVFAAARRPATAPTLQDLSRRYDDQIHIVDLDVASAAAIRAARVAVSRSTDTLDVLINNAAIYSTRRDRHGEPAERLGDLSMDEALDVLRINAVAPLILAQELFPMLRRGTRPRVVSITSGYGSISENDGGFPYYYSASKAALNQFSRSLAGEAARDDIVVAVMNPGWVRTDMGGAAATLTPERSVHGMIRVIDRLTRRDNGQFFDYTGSRQAW